MPPVRWQLFIALALFSIFLTLGASHDLPLTANGWRPIIGDRYEQRGPLVPQNAPSKTETQVVENAINQQQKNKQNSRNKNTPSSLNNHHHRPENGQNIRPKEPLKTQSSHTNYVKTSSGHIRVNHHGSTGHYSKHQMPSKPIHKSPPSSMMPNKPHGRHPGMPNPSQMGKGPSHQGLSSKRPLNKGKQPSPSRNQATAQSQRDEIIAQAPSSAIGSYAYFNQGPFNLRDTQLGDRNKPYGHHSDFRNHYNLQTSNSDLSPHVHHPHYTFSKHPSQNELHIQHFNQYYNQNDDFTRNLVPPPPGKTLVEKDSKEAPEKQTLHTNSKQFLLGKPRDEIRQRYPDNVVLQLPNFNYDDRPLDLEITREKLREYHTTLAPPLFSKGTTDGYSTIKFTNKPLGYNHGYEVTEDKNWHENSPFYQAFPRPTTPIRHQTYPTIVPDYRETTQFLPTPFIESVFPTVPTQSEVSTIYSEIAKLNRHNPYQTRYNIKEVATHFPIYDIKPTEPQIIVPVKVVPQEVIQETTTRKYQESTTQEYIPTTQEPSSTTTKATRSRQNVRRRRPIKPTTTEAYEVETERYIVTTSEKPQRRRRPIKYRTTESASENDETTRPSRRKPKPQVEEEQENYPPNFPVQQEVTENYPQVIQQEEKKLETVLSYKIETEPTTDFPKPTALQYSEEPEVESTTLIKRKRLRTTTEEPQLLTIFSFPENELDYTTQSTYTQEITTEEAKTPELTTVYTTTSTTTTEPTTKANRLRRPSKYDTHRPRFSVKDYKQRLTQYVSTTTETPKVSTSGTLGRIKYPSRFTKQPDSKEDDTEMLRFRFKPKEPRHRLSSTEQYMDPTTEKYKANRVRPFGRIRTTEPTSTTSAPKVAIKPNIFTSLKRPQSISLRTRILNKNKNTTTTEASIITEETHTEKAEVTIPIADNDMEGTTESFRRILENTSPDYDDKNEGVEPADDAEAFLQLQRITELTSQAKNNPSIFKNLHMSSTSRKVPNYFTISTDDPILPIEAFFPKFNRNDKNEQ